MLPAVVAHQFQQELEHYLRTTFAPATDRFERFFDGFFRDGQFFAGPYVSLGLPLTPQPMPEGLLEIAPGFDPCYPSHELTRVVTRTDPGSRHTN